MTERHFTNKSLEIRPKQISIRIEEIFESAFMAVGLRLLGQVRVNNMIISCSWFFSQQPNVFRSFFSFFYSFHFFQVSFQCGCVKKAMCFDRQYLAYHVEYANAASNVFLGLSSDSFHFSLCQVRFTSKVSLELKLFLDFNYYQRRNNGDDYRELYC